MCVTKRLLVPTDFHSMEREKKIQSTVNGYQKLFGYQHSSKTFCVQ